MPKINLKRERKSLKTHLVIERLLLEISLGHFLWFACQASLRVVLLATKPSGQHRSGAGNVVDLLSQTFFALVEQNQQYDQNCGDRTEREVNEGRQELKVRKEKVREFE